MAAPLCRVKPPAIIPLVNWQSEWLDRIAFLCFCNEQDGTGSILDLVSGKTLAGGSTSAKAGSIYGNTLLFDGTINSAYSNTTLNSFQLPGGANTTDVTILALASITASASAISQFAGQASAANADGFALYANSTVAYAVFSGAVVAACRHGGFNEAIALTGVVDGTYHVYCGRRAGGRLRIFSDGVGSGSTVSSTFDVAGGSPNLQIGGTSTNGTMNGNIALVMGWNRGLSDLEVQQISAYLWDTFIADDLDGLKTTVDILMAQACL